MKNMVHKIAKTKKEVVCGIRQKTLAALLVFLFLFALPEGKGQIMPYGKAATSGTYTSILGTTLSSGGGMDDATFGLTLPFSFSFNGTAYSNVYVSENGYLSFGTTDPGASTRSAISSGNSGFGVAAVFSADLEAIDANSKLTYQATGSAPSRIYTIQWKGLQFKGGTGQNFNFQIKLYESGDIQFMYGNCTNTGVSGTAQVGLRGDNNTTYFNSVTSTNWSIPGAGVTNSDSSLVSNTVRPASGLTYAYTYTTTPIIATTGSLSPFTTCNSMPSSAQTFSVAGVSLGDNLIITAPANFEISIVSSSGYSNTLTISPTSGTISSTTIYARMAASASTSSTGIITCSSTGATTKNINVRGSILTAGVITGATTVNAGATIALTDTTAGGTWSSSNASVATVSSTGVVTGISAGNAVISYAVTGSCGSVSDTHSVTVSAAPGTSGGIAACNAWANVGNAGFSIDMAAITDIATDTMGTPYMAYSDYANGNKVTVQKFNGTSWVVVGAAGFSGGTVQYMSLAFDKMNTPYVAFKDAGNGDKSTVMKFDGTSWVTVGTAGFSAGVANGVFLAINQAGVPYVAYRDFGNAQKLTVMKFNGSNWVTVGSAGFSAGNADYMSLAFGPAGTPYVGFSDYSSSNKSTVMKFNGTNWELVGSAGFSAGSAPYTSIVVDSTGVPYLAYGDGDNGGKIAVKKFDGTNWVSVGSAVFSAGPISSADFRINNAGTPYVAYMDVANTLKATVMKFNGVDWENVGSAGFTSGYAYSLSLAFGATGIPYVGFSDGSLNYKATVQAFLPLTVTISGAGSLCVGNSTTLSCTVAGGNWSSSDTAVARVGVAGTVTAVSVGSAIISYTLAGDYSAVYATQSITVNAMPAAPVITGAATLNVDGTITLTGSATGGTWSSSNASVAAVSSAGVVTGINAGNAVISYAVMGSCGTYYASRSITVNAVISPAPCGLWQYVGNAAFTPIYANEVAMAIDPLGNPYVALHDGEHDGKTSVMKFDGTAWMTVGNSNFSTYQGTFLSIAFNASGIPYVAYADGMYGNHGTINVRKLDGGTWVAVGETALTNSDGSSTAIAFDLTGTPYLAYADGLLYSKITVLKFNGTTWIPVGTSGFSTGAASSVKLMFSPSGTPYVTYTDAGNGYAGTVMKFDGASWIPVGGTGVIEGAVYSSLSLDINAAGVPYVAYADDLHSDKITVKKFNGSAWVVVGSEGFSPANINYMELSIDTAGVPYVAYADVSDGEKITVVRFDGSTWATIGQPAFSDGPAYPTSFMFSPSGKSYVAYIQTENQGKGSVVSFSGVQPSINGSSSICVGAASTLSCSAPGGIWSSSNAAVSTVDSAGIVTGTSIGSAIISYTVIGNCGPVHATQSITVNGMSDTPVISGAAAVNVDGAITLTASVTGGTWSSNNSLIADVNNAAVVTGVNAGNATITYSLSGCGGNLFATKNITVAYAGDTTNSSAACSRWNRLGNTSVITSASGFVFPTLAVAPSGTPYLAFSDFDHEGRATVAKFDGTSWLTVGNAGFSVGAGFLVFSAVGADEMPVVAYTDEIHRDKITVMKYTGSDWVTLGGEGAILCGGENAALLAIDPSNTPYVAYTDSATGRKATVKKYNGTAWVTVGSPALMPRQTVVGSFVMDAAGTPYISFSDSTENNKVTVAKFDGTNWVFVGARGFSADAVSYVSMAINPAGMPYVSYVDSASNHLIVKKFNGVKWLQVGNSDSAISTSASYLSLAFDTAGAPFVYYNEPGFTGVVKRYNGVSWRALGSESLIAGYSVFQSFAVSSSGIPYLARFDADGINVKQFSLVPATISGTDTLCEGNSITLTASIAGGVWSSSSTTVATINASTGILTGVSGGTVVITYDLGCGTPATFSVIVNPTPVVDIVADQEVCNGSATTPINFSGTATTYSWLSVGAPVGLASSGTGNIASFTATNSSSSAILFGTITVTPSANGCIGIGRNFTIVVNPTTTINLVNDQLLCNGELTTPVGFTGSALGITYSWTNSNNTIGLAAAGIGNIASFATINNADTMAVAVLSVTPTANGCSGTPISFMITVKPTPHVDFVADQEVCNENPTAPVNFTGTGTTYSWINYNTTIGLTGSGTGNIPSFGATNVSSSATLSGTVRVTPSANGCTGAGRNFTYTVYPTPEVDLLTDQVVCNGTSTAAANFTGTVSGTVYSWMNSDTTIGLAAAGTGNIGSFTAVNNTAAPVTATVNVSPMANGCVGGSRTLLYTVDATPMLSSTLTPLAICDSTLFTYHATSATAGAAFAWTRALTAGIANAANADNTDPSEHLDNTTVNPIQVAYVYTLTALGCAHAETITVTVNPTPVLNALLPAPICDSATFNYTPTSLTAGTVFAWSRDAVPGIANISGNGIDNPNEALYNTTAAPVSVVYVYTLSANGCSNTQAVPVIVSPTPVLASPHTIPAICDSTLLTYVPTSPTAGTIFTWNRSVVAGIANTSGSSTGDPAEVLDNNANAPVQVEYIYTLSANGCIHIESVTTTVNPTPALSGTLTPPSVCSGIPFSYAPTSLVATTTFNWSRAIVSGISNVSSTGVNDPNETLINTTASAKNVTYTYITSAYGCSDTQNVVVSIKPKPFLSSVSADSVCSEVAFTYVPTCAVAGASYTWTRPVAPGIGNAAVSGAGNVIETLQNTTRAPHTVTYQYVLTANGCTNPQNVVVTVNPAPAAPVVSIHPSAALCSNTMYQNFGTTAPTDSVVYNWTAQGATVYSQGNDHTYSIVNFPTAGTANVVLTANIHNIACYTADTFAVTVGSSVANNPEILYIRDHFICTDNTVDNYQWGYDDAASLDSTIFTGEVDQNFHQVTPDFAGKHYWVITNKGGCASKSYYNAPVGVTQVNAAEVATLTVFPNPAADNATIAVEGISGGNTTVELTDITGKIITTTAMQYNKAVINVNELASGIYIVSCYHNGVKVGTSKLVKN